MTGLNSLFALEIQVAFLLRGEDWHFALPAGGRIVEEFRKRVNATAAPMSPTVSRDGEILELLA